jgi:hypothetical protein
MDFKELCATKPDMGEHYSAYTVACIREDAGLYGIPITNDQIYDVAVVSLDIIDGLEEAVSNPHGYIDIEAATKTILRLIKHGKLSFDDLKDPIEDDTLTMIEDGVIDCDYLKEFGKTHPRQRGRQNIQRSAGCHVL